MKIQAEMLAFLRQVSVFKGTGTKHLLQLQFVLQKCTVQRGHILIMENQPCAGMFFIQSGQINILTRHSGSHAAAQTDSADVEIFTNEDPGYGPQADRLHSWRSRSRSSTGELQAVTGTFQQVAVVGPADYIGEVVASKHPFTAVAETSCQLMWLKPQELHMLGHKAMGLAMELNAMRQARWQQQQQRGQLDLHKVGDTVAAAPVVAQAR